MDSATKWQHSYHLWQNEDVYAGNDVYSCVRCNVSQMCKPCAAKNEAPPVLMGVEEEFTWTGCSTLVWYGFCLLPPERLAEAVVRRGTGLGSLNASNALVRLL